jgi:hypothetical protein
MGDLDEYGKTISRDKGKSYLRWLDNVSLMATNLNIKY